jgi:hypothetical protein
MQTLTTLVAVVVDLQVVVALATLTEARKTPVVVVVQPHYLLGQLLQAQE